MNLWAGSLPALAWTNSFLGSEQKLSGESDLEQVPQTAGAKTPPAAVTSLDTQLPMALWTVWRVGEHCLVKGIQRAPQGL